LTDSRTVFRRLCLQVRFKPETESRLVELPARSGLSPDELVEDAMAGYLAELAEVRDTLANRCEERKSERAKPMEGEAFFENLPDRENDLLNKCPHK
jgi:hypothetical protein